MFDKEKGAWRTAIIKCAICNHEQVSVYPSECEKLECGGCGYMIPAPGNPQEYYH